MGKDNKQEFEANGMAEENTGTDTLTVSKSDNAVKKLEKRIAELEAKNAELLAVKVDQNNVISELKQKLENAETSAKIGKPTFELDGKKYAFKISNAFILEGKKYTVADVLGDEALLNKIVTKKSGLVREL